MISLEDLKSYLYEFYEIECDNIKIIERLMFRRSYLIYKNDVCNYIVKEYPGNSSIEKLTDILEYYQCLKNRGIKVGCPIYRKDSSEFYVFLRGRYYVVFEYLQGERPQICQYELIAKCLDLYHRQAQIETLSFCTTTEEEITIAIKNFKYYETNMYMIKNLILSCKDNFNEIANKFRSNLNNNIIIHGDTIIENMIFNNTEVILIDFDNIRYGTRMEDIANTVISFMYYGTENYQIMPERLHYIRKFINTYYPDENANEEEILYNMKIHCIIELGKYAENITYLERLPKMKDYLLLLIKIINAKNFLELFNKQY